MGGGRTCLWYNGAMKLLLARALTGAFDATLQVASLDDGGDGAAALGTFNTWDYEVAGLFPPWTNAVTNAGL